MADARYHVTFADDAGEALGLLLTERPQLGFSRRLVNPYAAKAGTGATQDSDLTEWSVISQRDWTGGRGQEELEDGTAFLDGWNVESRIAKQLTLGPLPQVPTGSNWPAYEPGDVTAYAAGYPGPAKYHANEFTQYDRTFERSIYSGSSYDHYFWPGETPDGLDWMFVQSMKIYVKKSQAVTTGDIRVGIHDDDDGEPGSELAYKVLTQASVSTNFTWVEFEFATPLAVGQAKYHYKISATSPGGSHYYRMHTGTWAGTRTYRTYEVHYAPVALAQSFVPAGNITCSLVQLYVRKMRYPGTFTVKLCADNGGEPGTVLKSDTVDMDAAARAGWTWVAAEWTGQALSSGTTYWIVLEPPATADAVRSYVEWGGDEGEDYGASLVKVGSGDWEDLDYGSLYFRVNREELDDAPVAFARYDDDWYCGAGDTVYKWDTGSSTWVTSEEVADKDVTSLAVWGGYLWAARGSAANLRRYNGAAWADAAGPVTANLLLPGGGYLHRSGTGADQHKVYYTADGTSWTELGEAGVGDYAITGMAWYRDMLVVATAVRLWNMSVEGYAYPVLDWASQEDADNGRGMLSWSKTSYLYIPLLFGLYRWNGDSMQAMGPEQGVGLPAERAGKIATLCATGNWLYAAVDAGASGYSSILAYGGHGGWHEVQRCEQEGQSILGVGFETLSSPNRLWFGMGNETRYLMVPDYSDNPWQWTGYEFNAAGEVEMSWVGGDLLEVVKDLHAVVVRGEGISEDQPVEVYYEVDRSGLWTMLGQVTNSPRQEIPFEISDLATKTVGTGSTTTVIELADGSSTEDVSVGEWVRINGEISQVESVTDADTFVLAMALSAAPEAGDLVYGARAAGREFRPRLVLRTNDRTATPKIKAVFVRYQNNVLDRFVYTLEVRVEDGMEDLAGAAYPYAAAELRALLDGWAERVTPFTLVDPDGREATVKVVSAGEGGLTRVAGEALPIRYQSVYSMNLVEV